MEVMVSGAVLRGSVFRGSGVLVPRFRVFEVEDFLFWVTRFGVFEVRGFRYGVLVAVFSGLGFRVRGFGCWGLRFRVSQFGV